MKSNGLLISLVAVSIMLTACGPDYQFSRARKLEKSGKVYRAWEKYQEFSAAYPKHPKAAEAVFRAGLVAQNNFQDCFMADTFYDTVMSRYPQSDPWARWASLQKNSCPDYFPLIVDSKWEEVDSDTHGNNARIEVVCKKFPGAGKALPSEEGTLEKTYFAGSNKFESREFFYRKDKDALVELRNVTDVAPQLVLQWPLDVGSKWTTKRDNKLFRYEILAVNRTVNVVAGEFKECLLVRSVIEGDGVEKFEYYAPGVGRILTSVSSKGAEKRITELASYKIADTPSFDEEETRK